MNPYVRRLTPAFLCLMLCGAAAADDVVTRTFPFRAGDRLELEVEGGDLDYEVGGAGEITIEVTATRGTVAEHLTLTFEPRQDGLRVEGEKVHGGLFSGLFGGSDVPIRIHIVGPAELDMKLATAGGDIELPDLTGEIRAATSGGDIRFGAVDGSLRVATSGGDIEGDRVADAGSLATSGGDIRLREGGGDLHAATSGGDIEVQQVAGSLEAATSGGDIELGTVSGSASLRTSGGNVRVESAAGPLEISTSGGRIRVGRAGGEVRLATSGGDISLGEAAGRVEASTSGGDLEVTLTSGEGGDLGTSGGTLVVHLPAGAGFDLDADARGGNLHSAIAIAGTLSTDRAEGTIGGGGNLLRLRNRDGDIRIDAR